MEYKRLTLLCGHYGSGKTNIAVNMALDLRRRCERVAVADLDIVNPYFRTKDSSDDFSHAGIRLICSEFANSNLDIPAMPQDLYAITDDKSLHVIIDVGGDDRGAYALGRIAPDVIKENDYEMLMVINGYRPLTPDAPSTVEVMREIEAACGIRFTGLINNSNLGADTTEQTVLDSVGYAKSVEKAAGIPLVMTAVKESLYPGLRDKIPDLFPLRLQKNIISENN
ncbi:MAG: hypothetical protein MJ102_03440 [Clostridia bacterium]|nr:hypothetical protein [Clostridia bacterium]